MLEKNQGTALRRKKEKKMVGEQQGNNRLDRTSLCMYLINTYTLL